MMGVVSLRGRCRISLAVSNPSIPGMLTSSRMTAKSSRKRQRKASVPERARTRFWRKSESRTSWARSLSGRSSTIRILTFSSATSVGWNSLVMSTMHPAPQEREETFRIHGLGNVIACARFNTFLAIALHRLGGQSDDRKGGKAIHRANGTHGLVTIHLRQHDIHEHEINPLIAL